MENPIKDAGPWKARLSPEKRAVTSSWPWAAAAVLDSSVAISAMATNEGDLWDYVCGGTGKGKLLINKGLPIVTITTTAGTGSEINCWGVISNLETKEKIGSAILASHMFSLSLTPN